MATELIVALDVDELKKAEEFVDRLYPEVKIFKIGSQLFTFYGPMAVRMVQKKGASVFLDLKFHDIPNTVANAAAAAARLEVFMFTLHTQGGPKMMRRAREAVDAESAKLGTKPPLIIGVTVLTSEIQDSTIKSLVLSRAKEAKESGLDGIVASVAEAGLIRSNFGKDLRVVTAGIRLSHSHLSGKQAVPDDQRRTATALDAAGAGVDYIVVGRPILESSSPEETTKLILKQLS
jgi:orotidine-5'-phosphate decarboxylase